MKYRKKPVIIEAFQYDGDLIDKDGKRYVPLWAIEAYKEGVMFYAPLNNLPSELFIKTLEGDHHASVGDYIIQGVNGELYPCKPDIFEKTYECVQSEREELLKVLNEIQDEYDAFMMMNRYSWEEDENSHAKQFKMLIGANLKGAKAPNAIEWIHDRYDCHYKNEIEATENDPFSYLRGLIQDEKTNLLI